MERSPTDDIGSPLTVASVASGDDEIKEALNLVQQHLSTMVQYRCIVLFERACAYWYDY